MKAEYCTKSEYNNILDYKTNEIWIIHINNYILRIDFVFNDKLIYIL